MIDFAYFIQLGDGRWVQVSAEIFDMWKGKKRSNIIHNPTRKEI